jgi:DNA invertase Pin-like site-specific DNA recombinase
MNRTKINEAKRNHCDLMLMQFMPVKQIASALKMGRGTISERAKRAGMSRHYITNSEVLLLLKRRIGGGSK